MTPTSLASHVKRGGRSCHLLSTAFAVLSKLNVLVTWIIRCCFSKKLLTNAMYNKERWIMVNVFYLLLWYWWIHLHLSNNINMFFSLVCLPYSGIIYLMIYKIRYTIYKYIFISMNHIWFISKYLYSWEKKKYRYRYIDIWSIPHFFSILKKRYFY